MTDATLTILASIIALVAVSGLALMLSSLATTLAPKALKPITTNHPRLTTAAGTLLITLATLLESLGSKAILYH